MLRVDREWLGRLRVLRRDGRKQREERREKRANGRQIDALHFYKVPEGRDVAEKGRTLGETREERGGKTADRDEKTQTSTIKMCDVRFGE